MQPIVVKVSGHELDDAEFLAGFAAAIRDLDAPVIVVHGGGKEISTLQQQMGIEPKYVDGIRVTDAASLALVEMALRGSINTRVVRILVGAGVDAQGMSGVDRGLVRAGKMKHATQDMGFTGSVTTVRAEALTDLLSLGVTPVVAPICLGPDSALNVNADHVAGAIAAAVGADRLIFLSNVEGVLIGGQVASRLTPAQVEGYIADGSIYGGMIPKVQTALEALNHGVTEAVITNLNGLRAHGGTAFVAAGEKSQA